MKLHGVGIGKFISAGLLVACTFSGAAEAQRLLADGVKDLSEQIATKAKEQQKLRIAVLPFRELDGQPTVLGTFLAEELFTHLVNSGLEIIERSMLDRVLGEIKLDQTGLIDADTAKQVGKVIGVDAVVTGSITDLQSYVAINCRLIDASSGKIFAAAQAKIVKDDDVRKVMSASPPLPARPSTGTQVAGASESPRAVQPPSRPAPPAIVVAQEIRFELKTCETTGTSVTCELTVKNQGADQRLICWDSQSRLIDTAGNEVSAKEVVLGRNGGGVAETQLVSGVPIRARVRFDGVPSEADVASLVELGCYADSQLKVQFRDVPLTRR